MTIHSLTRTLLLVLLVLASACSRAKDDLPVAANLRADGAEAMRLRLPIVLFFYSHTCPYCREVEDDYLRPLLSDNAVKPRFLFRAVEIDVSRPLTDFSGRATTMQEFSRQQGVKLVPHLRFVGPDGTSLAPDLIGLTLRDFYGGYIEDAITQAGQKLQR